MKLLLIAVSIIILTALVFIFGVYWERYFNQIRSHYIVDDELEFVSDTGNEGKIPSGTILTSAGYDGKFPVYILYIKGDLIKPLKEYRSENSGKSGFKAPVTVYLSKDWK